MSGVLAVTWLRHRRTTELCAGMNIELAVLVTPLRGALRYLTLSVRTLKLLVRRRPNVLLVQSPSIVLGAFALLFRGVFRYRLVVDAHNEAVEPFKFQQRWILALTRWVNRGADLTIVTNRYLAELIKSRGGRPFTLPDRVPTAPLVAAQPLCGEFSAVLIAAIEPDEPCAEIFAAVRDMDVQLYVTGNSHRLDPAVTAAAPPNVHFTGYLEEADYWKLLRSADAIIDLTNKDNCLVCGAYEALAVSKPMLLSGNAASRELFGDCAIYTNNTPTDIRAGLARMRAERAPLEVAARARRTELNEQWSRAARELVIWMTTSPIAQRGKQLVD